MRGIPQIVRLRESVSPPGHQKSRRPRSSICPVGYRRLPMPLERAVHGALDRVKRRPGLLVVGATDRSESAVAARGPLPGPDCPPERAVLEIGSITKVFTALLLAI